MPINFVTNAYLFAFIG